MKIKLYCALFAGLLLSACASQEPIQKQEVGDNASVKLAEAANSVSNSLIELARIQAVATPPAKGKKLPDPATFGMHGVASVDWSGPIGPLVKRISLASHYKLRVLGKEPAVPIMVTVSTKDSPLASILRDVDFQAGTKAHIIVYPKTRVIELRYASV